MIPSNPMYVKECQRCQRLFDLRHLQHASIYIGFDGIIGKPYVSAFQNFFLD